MKVILLDPVEQIGTSDLFRGSFFTEGYRRVSCGHLIAQPGKDKAGHRRRPRHCRNEATYAVWDNQWTDFRCRVHQGKP